MQNNPEPGVPTLAEAQNRLHEAAQLLRDPISIDPKLHRALADLIDEVGRSLKVPTEPSIEVTRLAEQTAHLVKALHQGHDRGVLTRARDGIRDLIQEAEIRAPTTVGLIEKLMDALGNVGI